MARRRPSSPTARPQAGPAPLNLDAQRQLVERLMAQGNVKEAYKQAKFLLHKDASPENRALVERTYVARIEALAGGRMESAGKEVATSLLEFGVSDPALLEKLILLLPRVGLADKALALQSRIATPEARERLQNRIADRAVLHPAETPASMVDLRLGAGQVRAALDALDAGNEAQAQALELLQAIPRSSPLADWRLFVRGLAALRRDDAVQARANWDRLDPERAAHKIAATLSVDTAHGLRRLGTEAIRALDVAAYGEPVVERLKALQEALAAGDWKRILALVGPLRLCLRRIDPAFAERLTEILLGPLSRELMQQRDYRAAERTIASFKSVLQALPWDPQWHRFEAILWEGAQGSDDGALMHWRKYIETLNAQTPVPHGTWRQVQALVWHRIGSILSVQAGESEIDEGGDLYEELPDETQELRHDAVEALKECVACDPVLRRGYELLIENYTAWGEPKQVVATLEALVQALPDDAQAWRELLDAHQQQDAPERVLQCIERLRVLRPLDASLNAKEAWARMARARHLALKKKWDEARSELDRVEATVPEGFPTDRLWSRRAILELKAGESARSEACLAEARRANPNPAGVALSLAVEAVRYKVDKPAQKRFQAEFKQTLVGKVCSETAGAVSEAMIAYLASGVEYTGRAGHVRDIVAYLRRTTRLRYREPDLRAVCSLLEGLNKEQRLLETLSRRGLKQFPQSPFFLLLEAGQCLKQPPWFINPLHIQKLLDQALARAEASTDAQDALLVPEIKTMLVRLDDLKEALRSPFGRLPGPGGNGPRGLGGMFEAMFGAFPGDEEDEEPESAQQSRSRRQPR